MESFAFIFGFMAWPRRLAKTALFGSVTFAVLALLLGCHGFPTYQQKIHPSAAWMQPLDSQWILQSPGKAYSVKTSFNMNRDGEDSLRFELRGGERWVDKTFISTYRSEIATEQYPPAGAIKWYAFSVYFPADFPIEKNRLVFAQWHEKVPLLDQGLIPSLAFRFVDGKFSITLRHNDGKPVQDPDAVPSEELFRKGNFHRGRWHDFVVQVKWSYQQDGFVSIWWNAKQIVSYQGPVGYDPSLTQNLGPQFKFGLYRDATPATYIVYFNRVRIGDTAQDVHFLSPTTTISAQP